MTAYLPLLIALAGLVIYLASSNPKVAEVGRIMFAFGLLAFLLTFAHQVVGVLGK